MKSRLSSTIWLLVFWIGAALFGVLGMAYYAGSHAGAGGGATSLPGGRNGALVGAAVLALVASVSLVYVLSKRVLTPVAEIATFSERLVAGDVRARVEIGSGDEFGFIAENFNRSAAKVAHAVTNQQAQDSLQRSITDLLNTISQVARGDLNIRGKVSNDALGNVVDSVNFMLDNFTKVLERVRKAAVDVSASANQILEAADDMTAGATQQDQKITTTSSAVEELTVSMKQVSNNAEASAEAARRALDAAEQGNRAVRDTLARMQRIRSSVKHTAKKIKSLGDRSLEISEIINVINDITEQTNLLALNAAIEAARAGEAGRGFAGGAEGSGRCHGRRNARSGSGSGPRGSSRKGTRSDFERGPAVRRVGAGNFAGVETASARHRRRGERHADYFRYHAADHAGSASDSFHCGQHGQALRTTQRSARAIPLAIGAAFGSVCSRRFASNGTGGSTSVIVIRRDERTRA